MDIPLISNLTLTSVVFECPCGIVSSPHSLHLTLTSVVFEFCNHFTLYPSVF